MHNVLPVLWSGYCALPARLALAGCSGYSLIGLTVPERTCAIFILDVPTGAAGLRSLCGSPYRRSSAPVRLRWSDSLTATMAVNAYMAPGGWGLRRRRLGRVGGAALWPGYERWRWRW